MYIVVKCYNLILSCISNYDTSLVTFIINDLNLNTFYDEFENTYRYVRYLIATKYVQWLTNSLKNKLSNHAKNIMQKTIFI